MERKNTILLTVIAIATLLVAVVGATFAYFTASVTGDGNTDNKNTSTVNTAVLASVDYSNGTNFDLAEALPGAKGIQTFTVTPSGDNGGKGIYNITLTPDNANTLLTNVKYTLYKVAKANATANKIEVENVGTVQNGNQYTATDTFKTTGTLTTVKTGNITDTTAITLETVSFTMGTDGDAYTYYLAYEYENNTSADQSSESGKTFNATVTVSLGNPIA